MKNNAKYISPVDIHSDFLLTFPPICLSYQFKCTTQYNESDVNS